MCVLGSNKSCRNFLMSLLLCSGRFLVLPLGVEALPRHSCTASEYDQTVRL